MNEPLVSVIIPTYNRSSMIIETLNTILSQTYKNIEVIIIDDGSDDDTEKKVKEIDDKRIRYINAGSLHDIAKLRNIGINNSFGEYIAFCDDDDMWVNDKLEKQISISDKYNIICSNAVIVDSNCSGIKMHDNSFFNENEIIETKKLLLGNIVVTSSVLLKKEILSEGFMEKKSTTSAEDYELWLHLSLNNRIYKLGEPLVLFRRHSNTSSFDYGKKYINLLKSVINILSKYQKISDGEIKKYARYGIIKQKKELCKVLYYNSCYSEFLYHCFSMIKMIINPSFISMIINRKFSLR